MKGSTRLLGTERANLFQARVPEAWDATTIINTDRPDFTDALPTVGHRVTYVETGYNWAKDDVRVGDNFKPGDSSWYIGGGISFRFKPRKSRRARSSRVARSTLDG